MLTTLLLVRLGRPEVHGSVKFSTERQTSPSAPR